MKRGTLKVGLQYLKYAFDESDESVVDRWVENPYWQHFCGFTHMQHEAPIDPSSMSRWRKRVGPRRLELLLSETIELAVRAKQLPKRDLKQVTIDTTVQEKNITYPTDSKLLYTAIRKLGRAARDRGIPLRQSYIRVGKRVPARRDHGGSLRPRQAVQTHATAVAQAAHLRGTHDPRHRA